MDEINDLIDQIHTISRKYPKDTIYKVAQSFFELDDTDKNIESFQVGLIKSIPNADLRSELVDLLMKWEKVITKTGSSNIGFALLTALNIKDYYSNVSKTELVWTGPNTQIIPLRRTDQALLQVINSAKKELLIVSFAVYRIDFILQALLTASKRGVKITILLESEEESGGKLSFDGIETIGTAVKNKADIYVWPQGNRPKTKDGKFGVLHAKLALADSDLLFTSSANLTASAMELNMELGVLIYGGEQPLNVRRHFQTMIAEKIIEPY